MPTEVTPPVQLTAEQLSEFEWLVHAGGEVSGAGLSDRIANAHSLVRRFEDDRLVAIAAVKQPLASYRAKLSSKAGYVLAEDQFRYEFGWAFVVPEYQGRGLSRTLVEACVKEVGEQGLFATTREDNEAMRKTLIRFGFTQVGRPYQSDRTKVTLHLFVRNGSAS